jgi:serine/threonine protein kinase/tetratricopeptide (TPR) repeat protein
MTPGQEVADRFQIERLAGAGGMGSVFRALDLRTRQSVALKVLMTQMHHFADRFVREAEILAELRHPGIVDYVAHGDSASHGLYLAMEWLDGEDLSRRLARAPLSLGETLTLGADVGNALGFAHGRGVIHRDIKPSNLFLVGNRVDHVKILDFGIAHLPRAAVTHTGTMLGTPGYIAPEQARGSRDIDARADVFAMGCVVFECLTGRPPFVAEQPLGVLAKILFEEAPRVLALRPDVPTVLDDLVARMLSKDPEVRPRDGSAVARELSAIAQLPSIRLGSVPPDPAHVSSVPSHRPALTGAEKRLISVIFASNPAPPIPSDNDVTMRVEADTSDRPQLERIAQSFGGRYEPLVDGSAVVTVVAPGSATDQAARAARCALALRQVLPLSPMALATGRSVVTDRRLPVGEAIDRAVRLLRRARKVEPATEGDADAGIHLDDVTAGLLDGRFDVGGDQVGLVLRSEREQAPAERTLLGKPTSCVGRERDLALLFGLFEECLAEPLARAVLLTGPAGIGKSRIRHEALSRIRQREEPIQIWTARGDPMGTGSPFAMLGQAVRRGLGLVEGESLAVRQQKVRARVALHFVGEDAARVTEFIAELVSAPLPEGGSPRLRAARQDAMLMGDQLRRAWEDFVAAECADDPLVIVLEDLHWGDLPSVRLIEFALGRLHDRALFVLALARPEVHELFPSLWAERGVQEIRLGELSKKGSEKLVRQVLGESVDAVAVERIVAQAAGNAFYLEELIRAIAEGRGDTLPETVLAMIEARLMELEPDARRALRAASIFGQVFWAEGVAALLGGARRAPQLDRLLADLSKRELISTRGETRFPGATEYVFRHALVREAAYGMLTDQDRELGHRLAGAWLDGAGDSDAIVLAEHFDRGGEPARAVGLYRRAAEQALEGHDLGAALARASRGLLLGAAAGVAAEVTGALHVTEAAAHLWRGEFDATEQSATRAMSLLPSGSALWFRAATWAIVSESGRLMRLDKLEGWIASAAEARPAEDARGTRIVCLSRGAVALVAAGQRERAAALLADIEALVLAETGLDPAILADVHRSRAFHALYAGDLVGALEHFEMTIAAAEQANDARTACLIRCNLGFVYKQLGAFERAEQALRLSLSSAERMGLRNVCAAATHNLGMVLAFRGQLEEAALVEGRAVESYQTLGDKRLEGGSRCYLSAIALLAGDLELAEEEARKAVELLVISPPTRVAALAALARALLARGKLESADHAARDAVELLDTLLQVEEGEAAARLARAETLWANGEREAAVVALKAARARVLARAGAIQRPELRQSYLGRVPENARLLELVREWRLEPAEADDLTVLPPRA